MSEVPLYSHVDVSVCHARSRRITPLHHLEEGEQGLEEGEQVLGAVAAREPCPVVHGLQPNTPRQGYLAHNLQ